MEHSSTQAPVVRLRYRYDATVLQIIAADGEWTRIDPFAISGNSKATKQTRLLQAGRERGHRFQTTFQADGLVYARLIKRDGRAQ